MRPALSFDEWMVQASSQLPSDAVVNLPIVSRAVAMEYGLTYYYTGKPCVRGHVDRRNVLETKCLACMSAKSKARRERDPERLKETSRRSYHKYKEDRKKKMLSYRLANKEALAEKRRENYEKNRDKILESHRACWNKNKAAYAETNRKWRAENPEKVRAGLNARRARVKEIGGKIDAADIARILRAQKDKCAYCRDSLRGVSWHVDHIRPVSKGGANIPSNAQILCAPCNRKKYNKDPLDFARQLGMLL